MSTTCTTHPTNLHTITNRTTHDAAISLASTHPTLIYISSSSIPACQTAYPKVIALAEANAHVAVYVLELTAETTPMIKFGPQNTPIFILMKGGFCETVLGPDFRRVGGILERWREEEK